MGKAALLLFYCTDYAATDQCVYQRRWATTLRASLHVCRAIVRLQCCCALDRRWRRVLESVFEIRNTIRRMLFPNRCKNNLRQSEDCFWTNASYPVSISFVPCSLLVCIFRPQISRGPLASHGIPSHTCSCRWLPWGWIVFTPDWSSSKKCCNTLNSSNLRVKIATS